MLDRPLPEEYAPYYESYIALVTEGNLIDRLSLQMEDMLTLLMTVTDEMGVYRYAPNKWSLKEVIGHITDTERIMSYRLLRVARGDSTPLAGFNENDYVAAASFNDHNIRKLIHDFAMVRASTVSLCLELSDDAWLRKGTVNNYSVTARSIAYMIAGHELHHYHMIKERYLPKHSIKNE